MSSIKTTHINGDISVGRNVAIGGNTTIQGNSLFKGNVKVDGWFDAKNIKYANKGLFETLDKLEQNYPSPRNGWWAIVGNTLPGTLYIAYDRKWINTGNIAGEPTIDCDIFNEQLTTIRNNIAELQQESEKLQELEVRLEEVVSAGSDVVEFWAVENFEDTVQDKTDKSADDDGCLVVYSPEHSAFFLRVPTEFTALYYKTWNGSSQWNRWLDSAGGYRPRANKLYVCVSDNGALYWWNSTELVKVTTLSEEYESVTEELSRINHELTQLITKTESTDTNVSNLNDKVTELTNNVDGLSKQVVDVEDTVINLNDKVLNLATINGKSLLDGGDIVITGDGVMIEPIPEEDIKNLGDY